MVSVDELEGCNQLRCQSNNSGLLYAPRHGDQPMQHFQTGGAFAQSKAGRSKLIRARLMSAFAVS